MLALATDGFYTAIVLVPLSTGGAPPPCPDPPVMHPVEPTLIVEGPIAPTLIVESDEC